MADRFRGSDVRGGILAYCGDRGGRDGVGADGEPVGSKSIGRETGDRAAEGWMGWREEHVVERSELQWERCILTDPIEESNQSFWKGLIVFEYD